MISSRKFVVMALSAWMSLVAATSCLAATTPYFNRQFIDELLARVPPGEDVVYIGDMGFKVSYLQQLRATLEKKKAGASIASASVTGITQWPGGVVPYVFNSNVNATQRGQWVAACQEWEKYANVKFVQRISQPNYIRVTNHPQYNNSLLGMAGGLQEINIHDWGFKFLICHEIAHALGFCHEQVRSDRDAYVTINTGNIVSGMEHNFTKINSNNRTPYDFDSVMHYGANFFSKNGLNTITPKSGYEAAAANMGRQEHLSFYDKLGMVAMYGVPGSDSANVNLTLYQPSGWSGKVVVSKTAGTNTDSLSLLSTDMVYVDYAPYNAGSSATSNSWYSSLYVDNVWITGITRSTSLASNNYYAVTDWAVGPLSAGTHVIKVVVDDGDDVSESNEGDNSFTKTITITATTPIVKTTSASSIALNSATTGGNVTSGGGYAVTERGVVYALTPNPTTDGGAKVASGSGTGSFTSSLTGLNSGTTYYVRAYAINTIGIAYGSQVSFTTLGNPVFLSTVTTSAMGITANSATGGGNVTSSGGGTVAERGVVYAINPNPALGSGTKVAAGSGTGIFSCNLTGLSSNTIYYMRAYAINEAGTAYGPQISFITELGGSVLSLIPTDRIMSAAGGNYSFAVVTLGGWSWTISGGSSWVTTSEAASQSGNQTFNLAVATNDTSKSRSATITLTAGFLVATHVITQVASDGGMGTVVAWGRDFSGQTVPTECLGGVTAVAAGSRRTAALKADGTLAGWGGGTAEFAGLSGITAIAMGMEHSVMVKADGTVATVGGQTTTPGDLNSVTAVAAGWFHTAALRENGTVTAWGGNSYGETNVPAGLSGVTAIAAGWFHTVALKNDGTVVAWGTNEVGETDVPTDLSGVVAIAAGGSHTVAVKNDGTVVAWGWNGYGQTNVPAGLTDVTAVAAGDGHTVALKADGTVVLWGRESVVPEGLNGVTAIAAGGGHTVALIGKPSQFLTVAPASQSASATGNSYSFDVAATGSWSWSLSSGSSWVNTLEAASQSGSQTFSYTVASNTDTSPRSAIITLTSGSITVTHVITQMSARGGAGRVVAWGLNNRGQTEVPEGLTDVIAIAASWEHTAALKADGTVVAWGDNTYGQTEVPTNLISAIAIATGYSHTVALKGDGTVVAWGRNDYGQTEVPPDLNGVIAIAAGEYHTVALKVNGTVVGWGRNDYGQTNMPVGLSGVTSIAVGSDNTLMVKANGTVVAKGGHIVPEDLIGVTSVATSRDHAVALKSDSKVVAWGDSDYGQTKVPAGLKGVIAVATGAAHTVALKADGTVMAWGYNGDGETKVPAGVKHVGAIAAGRGHTVALVLNPLSLILSKDTPGTAATPAKAGTVMLKTVPLDAVSKLIDGSFSILPGTIVAMTATANKGFLFSHWDGLPPGAEEAGNVVAFFMPSTAVPNLTAVFVENPFLSAPFKALGSKPIFQGLLRPGEDTPASNATTGLLAATLTASGGSLSGKVSMDGKVTSYTGLMRGDGSVWFKVGNVLKASLPLLNGEAAGKSLTASWSATGLQATVNGPEGASSGLAQPPLYSKTNLIPADSDLLDSKRKQGYFTLALLAPVPGSPEEAATYPQGAGYSSLTLINNGTLKLAGVLADGTKITASSFVVTGDESAVFVELPTPGGKTKNSSVQGVLKFDSTQPNSDVTSAELQWFRAAAETKLTVSQSYRAGWPGGLPLETVGALYDGTQTVQDTLDLGAVIPGGNAALGLTAGKLTGSLEISVNLNGSKVEKLNAQDKSFTLSFTPKTGLFKGTFTPNWTTPGKTLPAFQGILIQKGSSKSGNGYFLSNRLADLNPESGAVQIDGD